MGQRVLRGKAMQEVLHRAVLAMVLALVAAGLAQSVKTLVTATATAVTVVLGHLLQLQDRQ